MVEQLMYRPAEAARVLGIGRTSVFALLKSGRLRSVRLGGARCGVGTFACPGPARGSRSGQGRWFIAAACHRRARDCLSEAGRRWSRQCACR
jgi:excisionase family DNA binding protein